MFSTLRAYKHDVQMKVVLLPGLDGTGILFKPLLDVFPKDIIPLVISYPPDATLSYKELVDFVLDQLPEENFILVAESFSGPIAYQVVLRKPGNLLSVIFVATFLSYPRRLLIKFSRLLPISLLLKLPIPDFVLKLLLFGPVTNNQLIDLFRQSMKQVSANVLSFRLREIANLPTEHQPCDIKATYLQATDDKLVPSSCLKDFERMFKNLSVLQVKSSHFILQTNPITCTDVLTKEIRLTKNHSA
jgi:pimeloyl-ACP methyl ester carboxylesterase